MFIRRHYDDALGAPDDTSALVADPLGLGGGLALDMGAGEEGTGNLTMHYGGLSTSLRITVSFRNANQQLIATREVTLTAGTGIQTVLVEYDQAPTPYRYVQFAGLISGFFLDGVVAATYRPDSDGDTLPDVWELQHGLDPLDGTGDNGANGDPDNDGLTNAQERAAATDPTDSDSDDDGLPDGWELQHGLDPLDGTGDNGANGDPDNDGRSNIQEYRDGTNPHASDTPPTPNGKHNVYLPVIARSG